tara:strand:- start:81 stop:662 length:582 start_codon:yes stop_codon:yes gene_type:complete
MAVKTMTQNTGTGLYNAGWHELTISSAEYDLWTDPKGNSKRYIDLRFEGYPENMNLRIYEAVNRETNVEFKIANLFRYACAGIIDVLKDPTGKNPVIQYDDEPHHLIGKRIHALFYKQTDQTTGKEYSRIFDGIAPVEQETEHITWKTDDVNRLKSSVEKRHATRNGTTTNVNPPSVTSTIRTTTEHDAEIPF